MFYGMYARGFAFAIELLLAVPLAPRRIYFYVSHDVSIYIYIYIYIYVYILSL